jgi:hypothetical protein
MAQLDENKLHEFVGKMLGDLGGAFSVATVRIGLRLGLFNALHQGGPATSDELARRAGGLTERYVREWALAQAANVAIAGEGRKHMIVPQVLRPCFIMLRRSRKGRRKQSQRFPEAMRIEVRQAGLSKSVLEDRPNRTSATPVPTVQSGCRESRIRAHRDFRHKKQCHETVRC